MIELDPADEAAALAVAQSSTRTARAEAKRALARIEVARASHAVAVGRAARAQRLSAQGVSASSVAEDLQATANALRSEVFAAEAEAELVVAEARTNEARARVALQSARLNNLLLLAPFQGVVVNEPPHVGEYIGPQPAGVAADMGGASPGESCHSESGNRHSRNSLPHASSGDADDHSLGCLPKFGVSGSCCHGDLSGESRQGDRSGERYFRGGGRRRCAESSGSGVLPISKDSQRQID